MTIKLEQSQYEELMQLIRAQAALLRLHAMADEIAAGGWGEHWREINVHGAIRAAIKGGTQ